jgi:GDP-L-fucose synthase
MLHKYGILLSDHGVQIEIWGTEPHRDILYPDMAEASVFVMQQVDFKDIVFQKWVRNAHLNIGTGQ